MIKGKLKNMVHALLMKRIDSGVKDGHVMVGGKKHPPDWDISTGSYFDFGTMRTIFESPIQAKYLATTSEDKMSISEQLNFQYLSK
jgi:hypothetical protein